MADEVELPELDRLLRQELSVEPSAGFLPGVRARIERERDASATAGRIRVPWWLRRPSWQLAAGLAMHVVAVSTLLLMRSPTTPGSTPTTDVATTEAPAVDPVKRVLSPPAPSELTVLTERLAQSRAPRTVGPRPRGDVPSVEVIVAPGQRAAISRVMELVNDGRLTEASFVASRPSEIPVIEDVTTTPIAVDALMVSPVVVGGVLQKGTERN
jgi:hypothetical protein